MIRPNDIYDSTVYFCQGISVNSFQQNGNINRKPIVKIILITMMGLYSIINGFTRIK